MSVYFIKTIILSPAIQLILCIIGLLLWKRRRFMSISCLSFGFLSLWILALPVTKHTLYQWLESPYQAHSPKQPPQNTQAIVVLSAGRHSQAMEYEGDTVGQSYLWRLRYGAYLANRWNLPIIVSGGIVRSNSHQSEALLGQQVLINEFKVSTVWLETESKNTWENAHSTKQVLDKQDIHRVILVTHGYHMRRSSYAFQQAGIEHIPMPTGMISKELDIWRWDQWVPKAGALASSYRALHEYLGLIFYRFK